MEISFLFPRLIMMPGYDVKAEALAVSCLVLSQPEID